MNLAVVVSGGIAETLQATPLLRTVRAGAPDARITFLCPAAAAAVAAGVPAVDELVPLAGLDGRGGGFGAISLWLALRRRRFEAVLLCSSATSVRLAAYLAGVPQRIGPGGGPTAALLTGRAEAPAAENAAATWLRLAALLGITLQLHAPSFEPGPEARLEAERLVHKTGFTDGRLLIALAPGSGMFEPAGAAPATRAPTAWDPERYALLANLLAQRHGAGVILIGSAADRPAIEQMLLDLGAPVADFSGERDIRLVAAILARCDLLVTSDSPLLHLAAAVGTSAVGLFGPTDGRARSSYGTDHRIIQALPAGAAVDGGPREASMDRIRVDDVLASIEATL